MIAYTFRRLLFMIPTLLGIMIVNFVIVQAAPGGPVDVMIARIKGHGAEERFGYWTKLSRPETIPALGLGHMGGVSTFGMGESAIALWWANPNPPAPAQSTSAQGPRHGWIVGLVAAGVVMMVWILMRRRKPGRP